MVRTAHIDNASIEYLKELSKTDPLAVGLILGQPLEHEDFIVHLTKTPVSDTLTLSDFPESSLSEHAKASTRMLPGGMYVRGIFVITADNIFQPLAQQVKFLITHVHNRLNNNTLMYGNPPFQDKLIIHFDPTQKQASCRLFNIQTGALSNVILNISHNVGFIRLECLFEINEVIPIVNTILPLKTQLKYIISTINSCLQSAVYLFDGKLPKNSDEIKSKRQVASTTKAEESDRAMMVNILLPSNCTSGVYSTDILDTIGILRIAGLLACNIWMHPSATFGRAAEAVKEDICRSLITRLGMHFDSLTEGERGQFYESSSVHEPPRRVLIPIPYKGMMFSDYLFPGEGPQETLVSFQDVLDITITNRIDIKDMEKQADLTDFYEREDVASPQPLLHDEVKQSNKHIYIAGAVVAVLVLIVSLLIHYLRSDN